MAIVTGFGQKNGIGADIFTVLALNGASVITNYFSDSTTAQAQQLTDTLRTEHEVSVAVVQADVETPKGAARLVEDARVASAVDHIGILGMILLCSS